MAASRQRWHGPRSEFPWEQEALEFIRKSLPDVPLCAGWQCLPEIDEKALAGLKFNAALPEHLARATLSARLADLDSAATVLAEPALFART